MAPKDEANLHAQRGATLTLDGRYNDAIEAYNLALLLDPNKDDCYATRGACYAVTGRLYQ